ncbi:hypothetical protein [Sulfitobacter sp. MF3-043]|uniref:hypothetical protein n=1 Tax=Sulfitobacter sediminivivens TaxID=3252902 RepID=UPI0036D97C6D
MTTIKAHAAPIAILSIISLTACAVPDVTKEIDASQKAIQALDLPLDKVLAAGEASALAQQVDALIHAGEYVYEPSEACYLIGNNEFTSAPCGLEEAFAPDADLIRFRNARAILESMKLYLESVAELAASDTPEKIAANTQQLFADLNTLSETVPGILKADANSGLQKRSTSVPMIFEFAAEWARNNALRKAVRSGDDAVELGVLTMIAFLRESGDAPRAGGLAEINAAADRVEEARTSGNAAEYSAALDALKKITERVEKGRKASLEADLISFRLAHRAMAEKLLGPASLAQLRDATKEVADIRVAISEEDQS